MSEKRPVYRGLTRYRTALHGGLIAHDRGEWLSITDVDRAIMRCIRRRRRILEGCETRGLVIANEEALSALHDVFDRIFGS